MGPYRRNTRREPEPEHEHNDMFSDPISCPNCAGMRLLVGIPILCFALVQLGWCKLPPPRECEPGECVRREEDHLFAHGNRECLEWCPKPIEVRLSPEDRKLLANVIAEAIKVPPDAGR
jgi:hypothetical protein